MLPCHPTGQGSRSFWKKEPRNFCYCPDLTAHSAPSVRGTGGKSFCFFFQKSAFFLT
jgi:hypothetical protein